MKLMKLFSSAAALCLLIGAAGAATAPEDCAGGYLTGFIVRDIIIPEGGSCVIQKAIVLGDIKAEGALDVTVDARVSGNIVIKDSVLANVEGSQAKNIILRRNEIALLLGSSAKKDMEVIANVRAWVKKNQTEGNLICRNNIELSAVENWAAGTEECGF